MKIIEYMLVSCVTILCAIFLIIVVDKVLMSDKIVLQSSEWNCVEVVTVKRSKTILIGKVTFPQSELVNECKEYRKGE